MARPRSDYKRSAIIAAATRVFAAQGLSAATAAIAKEAGVSNGSLFIYFETKSDLLNQLFLDLKAEMAAAALEGLPFKSSSRKQLLYMWSHWLRWATSYPERRQTLAHLSVAKEITQESRQIASRSLAGIAEILERSRKNGPMRDAPRELLFALLSALADTTMDFMIRDPANADEHCMAAFKAIWQMVT